jgi:hypothetical protein
MFWHWSLFLSSFALVSLAHQTLLRYLPEEEGQSFDKKQSTAALSLFLQPPVREDGQRRRISRKMLWFWQCPTMLMSYSWVFFLTGYALHLLTPLFDPSQAEIPRTVSVERSTLYKDAVIKIL